MFTGIVTDVGRVRAAVPGGTGRDTRFEISCAYAMDGVDLGASIACSGPCLTVTEKGADWFAVEASGETLRRTTLGDWAVGTPVNLERSLTAGQELGGHIVTGHVDAVSTVLDRRDDGGSAVYVFDLPRDLARFVAIKGSIAIDGVSLTVNGVEDGVDGARFDVNIIRHTQEATTFGALQTGGRVNLEVDTLARYVDRQIALRHTSGGGS
jgi:riboflavin synthase